MFEMVFAYTILYCDIITSIHYHDLAQTGRLFTICIVTIRQALVTPAAHFFLVLLRSSLYENTIPY